MSGFNEYINRNFGLLILIAVILFLLFLSILILILTRKHRRSKPELLDPYAEMDGQEFENYCAELLKRNGFTEIEMTPATADFGVDIFAEKDGLTYAFQCKCYNHPVGTKAVQEIYAGRDFYHCMVGVVMTNERYTSGAAKLAEAFNILLWDGEKLEELEN